MWNRVLQQLASKYVHDKLVNSPTFHRAVRATHDRIKGIQQHDHSNSTGPPNPEIYLIPTKILALTHKVKKFSQLYLEEFKENFRKR